MTTTSPIREMDREMLNAATSAALDLLPGCRRGDSTPSVIDALQEHLDGIFVAGELGPLGEDAPMAFGALFGSVICDVFGWRWVIASSGEWNGLGVVDPEQHFLVLPLAFMDEMFSTGGESDLSPKLIFNCIKDRNLPPASANQLLLLTLPIGPSRSNRSSRSSRSSRSIANMAAIQGMPVLTLRVPRVLGESNLDSQRARFSSPPGC